jgi:hypothetical protein
MCRWGPVCQVAAPVGKVPAESVQSRHKLAMQSGDLRVHRSHVLRNVFYKLHSCGGWKKQEGGKSREAPFA